MRLDDLARVLRDLEDSLIAIGVSRPAARKAALDAEVVAVADLLETQTDVRLLDLFEEVGCAKLAERDGVNRNTIYARRVQAIERLAAKHISRRTEQTTGQEAA